MKKLITSIIALVMICAAFSGISADAKLAETATLPHTDAVSDKAADDHKYSGFLGRLSILDVGIDVALYNSSSQSVCDRWDSACMFSISPYPGKIIADHSNQEFSALTGVTVGATGKITLDNGDVINIRCAEFFDGHNTGDYITDADWNVVFGKYDYLTYTCMNGWQNVRVCQWEIVEG